MMRPPTSLFLCALFCVLGCSRGQGPLSRLPDGGYRLSCQGPLADCLAQLERVCGAAGYTITYAKDVRELLGHESGQSQVEVRRSRATAYCGDAPRSDQPPADVDLARPASMAPPVAAPAPPPAERACVPGATQACVGPGGCAGGQACSADGARFEPCDCGAAAPAP